MVHLAATLGLHPKLPTNRTRASCPDLPGVGVVKAVADTIPGMAQQAMDIV